MRDDFLYIEEAPNDIFIQRIPEVDLLPKLRINLSKDVIEEYNFDNFGKLAKSGDKYSEKYKDILHGVLSEEQEATVIADFSREKLLNKFDNGIPETVAEFQRRLPNGDIIWIRSINRFAKESESGDVKCFCYLENITTAKVTELAFQHIVKRNYGVIGTINVRTGCIRFLSGSSAFGNGKVTSSGYAEIVGGIFERFQYKVSEDDRIAAKKLLDIDYLITQLKIFDPFVFFLNLDEGTPKEINLEFDYSYVDKQKSQILISMADVTQTVKREREKQAELEAALHKAQEASDAKNAFLSRMSHDMRTPLNAVLGFAQLTEETDNLEEVKENVARIKASGEILLSLINEILELSTIQDKSFSLNEDTVDGFSFIDSIVDGFVPLAARKGITLKKDMGNCIDSLVVIDKLRMQKVLINLLSNAFKFTPEGGTVALNFQTLSRDEHTSKVRFSIMDTGIGISQSFLSKIFEPFEQENAKISTEYGGSGLGLSIVKRNIEAMGGTIEVESRKGEGSTFVVEMDLQRDDKERESKVELPKADLTGIRVLLCEDNPLNRELVRKIFEKRGILLTTASNGEEAVSLIKEKSAEEFDLIFMDIRMPLIDGITASRMIRELDVPGASSIPIIAMTANAYSTDIQNCIEAGMNAHVAKPINKDQLYEIVAQYGLGRNNG